MKVIFNKLLYEPAAVIGLLGAIATYLTVGDLLLSLAYLASALGVRQLVTPSRESAPKDEDNYVS